MKKNRLSRLIEQGKRNFSDADYIRSKVIPLAQHDERWSIVVSDAHRVIELLLKGIICFTGNGPKHEHTINNMVKELIEILEKEPERPLFYAIFDTNDEGYYVYIINKKIIIGIQDDGSDTILSYSNLPSRFLSADKLI